VIPLSTREIAAVTGGAASGPEATVTGVAIDSRDIRPGDLFATLPGERTHGARFADAALAAGAGAVLLEGETAVPGTHVSAVHVDSAVAALGAIAAEVRRRSAAQVVAITGSTGKTSTKDILAAILRSRLRTIASRRPRPTGRSRLVRGAGSSARTSRHAGHASRALRSVLLGWMRPDHPRRNSRERRRRLSAISSTLVGIGTGVHAGLTGVGPSAVRSNSEPNAASAAGPSASA